MNENVPSNQYDILLGSNPNVHFQSLLPITEDSLITDDTASNFSYEYNGENLNFIFTGSKIVKCARCKKEFKNILRHLQQSKCAVFNLIDFRCKFKSYIKTTFSSERKKISK